MYSRAELGLESGVAYGAQLERFERAACDARCAGDVPGLANAELELGRVKEKLGDFVGAWSLGQQAVKGFRESQDVGGSAQCSHTMGVWAFHHGEDSDALECLLAAALAREQAGELLLAAQSWHNLGYVQCRLKKPECSFSSYRDARRLLDQVSADEPALADKADRNLGFVLSHITFAMAKYRGHDDALGAALQYFEHVARTGTHKEPLLAYIGSAIALDSGRVDDKEAALRLQALTGLDCEPEAWFRFSVDEGRRALIGHEPGTGRRPYLGARLLTLAEYGSWCLRNGRPTEGRALIAEAVSIANARGWKGEARRLSSE